MFPMELALWTLSRKLEIGFELDLWPQQMMPHVLYWMHSITTHMNGNRVAFLSPFSPSDQTGNILTYNQLLYSQMKERARGFVFNAYFDYGRLTLMKANLVMLALLDKAGALRKFMTDRELELSYDAKIYLPFSEYFFIKRPRFNEAQGEIATLVKTLGESVIQV